MSYRLHRGMGWGLPWNEFEATTILDCEAQDTEETLSDVIGAATDADLTVPDEVRSLTWRTRGINAIMDPRLLALDMEFEGEGEERHRVEPQLGSPSELWCMVMDPDNTHAVLFFPNVGVGRRWTRSWDDLDYVFEAYRDGPPGRDGGAPRDFMHVMQFNPYPYGNFLMDKDGQPLEWESFHRLDDAYPQGWYPAVPSEIRWWTKKLGILDDAGVNKLRPIVAQWWC